ncbi:hypothetical protein [Arthrobacter humicola]
MTHRPSTVLMVGATTSERDVRDNDYAGVAYALWKLRSFTTVFSSLAPDLAGSIDAAEDLVNLPLGSEPERFRPDLATIAAGSVNAGH